MGKIELVEITATVYEVGAKIWLSYDKNFIDHAMVILPEPERIENSYGFDVSNDFQEWFGTINNEFSYPHFITKCPMIGLDFNHISEGISADGSEYISFTDHEIGNIGTDFFYDFIPDILNEINLSIDSMLSRLPMKNMWKEQSKVHAFRFVIAFEFTSHSSYDYYGGGVEYDTYVDWLGRVHIQDIMKIFSNND